MEEREANSFAAELLMPEKGLLKDVKTFGIDHETFARRYIVSKEAMWIRLIELGLVTESDHHI